MSDRAQEHRLKTFIEGDRQWLHYQRVAHAKYQLRCARNSGAVAEEEFWRTVLKRLGSTPQQGPAQLQGDA